MCPCSRDRRASAPPRASAAWRWASSVRCGDRRGTARRETPEQTRSREGIGQVDGPVLMSLQERLREHRIVGVIYVGGDGKVPWGTERHHPTETHASCDRGGSWSGADSSSWSSKSTERWPMSQRRWTGMARWHPMLIALIAPLFRPSCTRGWPRLTSRSRRW